MRCSLSSVSHLCCDRDGSPSLSRRTATQSPCGLPVTGLTVYQPSGGAVGAGAGLVGAGLPGPGFRFAATTSDTVITTMVKNAGAATRRDTVRPLGPLPEPERG